MPLLHRPKVRQGGIRPHPHHKTRLKSLIFVTALPGGQVPTVAALAGNPTKNNTPQMMDLAKTLDSRAIALHLGSRLSWMWQGARLQRRY